MRSDDGIDCWQIRYYHTVQASWTDWLHHWEWNCGIPGLICVYLSFHWRSHRNSKPSVDGAPVVVSANTLKEAYAIVREDYGEDAIILGTRTVNQRQELGLGHERQVQVTVQ